MNIIDATPKEKTSRWSRFRAELQKLPSGKAIALDIPDGKDDKKWRTRVITESHANTHEIEATISGRQIIVARTEPCDCYRCSIARDSLREHNEVKKARLTLRALSPDLYDKARIDECCCSLCRDKGLRYRPWIEDAVQSPAI